MNESKTEQFLFRFEFDDEELQEIMHKMEQAINTLGDCVYQLERLGKKKRPPTISDGLTGNYSSDSSNSSTNPLSTFATLLITLFMSQIVHVCD